MEYEQIFKRIIIGELQRALAQHNFLLKECWCVPLLLPSSSYHLHAGETDQGTYLDEYLIHEMDNEFLFQ